MTPLEKLGFGIAAALWMESRGSEGRLLAELIYAAPGVCAWAVLERCGYKGSHLAASSLKTNVCWLRSSLADLGHVDAITTVRGEGLAFVGDVSAVRASVEAFA